MGCYKGQMDGWHGDEHLAKNCHRDCIDYCNCAELDAEQKAEDDYAFYRDNEILELSE